MRRIIVTGCESTGTRWLCRVIEEAGGESIHSVIPKSVPWMTDTHPDGVWLPLDWYEPNVRADAAVVLFRDLMPTVRSQAELHVPDEDAAFGRIRAAYAWIFKELDRLQLPWLPVTYEALARPDALVYLLEALGLPGGATTRWQDGNAKHYGETAFVRPPENPPLVPKLPLAVLLETSQKAKPN